MWTPRACRQPLSTALCSPKLRACSTSVIGTRALAHELAADLHGAIRAAVVHEHDLVAAVDGEAFDFVHQRADRVGAVVHRDDETERNRHVVDGRQRRERARLALSPGSSFDNLEKRTTEQFLAREAGFRGLLHRQCAGAQSSHEEVQQALTRRRIVEDVAEERRLRRLVHERPQPAPSLPDARTERTQTPRRSASAAAPGADPTPDSSRSSANGARRRSESSRRDGRPRDSRAVERR